MANNCFKICECSKSFHVFEEGLKRATKCIVNPRRMICHAGQPQMNCIQNLNAPLGYFGTFHNHNKNMVKINLNSNDFAFWQTKRNHHSIASGFINASFNVCHTKQESICNCYGKNQYETRANFYGDSPDSIEKKLIKLMDMWELDKAVELIKVSVKEGIIPHQNIILNLLQQLAHLGEYEYLLELYSFLLDHKLCTEIRFFECLQEAYYNSGRVDEGVRVLRLFFNRNKNFKDVDVFFTFLTVMVMRYFPNRLVLIEEFVKDLKNAPEPVIIPEAALWKCYMLTERFEEAENLLLKSEEIQPFVPQMVADICLKKNQIVSNYEVVLPKLLDVPNLRNKLRVFIIESYAYTLCQNGKLEECLQVLTMARSQSIPVHPDKIRHLLQDISSRSPSEHVLSIVQELSTWLNEFE